MMKRSLIAVALTSAVGGCTNLPATPPDMTPPGQEDARVVDPPSCAGGWLVANVPRGGTDATYALSADDNWHVVYQHPTLGARHVAENAISEADTLNSYGRPVAVAVSSTGTVNAFLDIVNQGILVVSLSQGTWVANGKPFLTGQKASTVAARADHAGHTHALYADLGIRDLTDVSGTWTEQSPGDRLLDDFHAMALDGAGHVHAFYDRYDIMQGVPPKVTPEWATDASGSWKTTDMPMMFTAAAGVVDHAGQPHVFGTRAGDASAHLLSYQAGAWKDETLPAAVGAVQDARIDAADHYHVVGEDLAAGNVVYATDASGSWVTTTVRNVGANVRARAWIDLNAAGAPRVAFDSELDGSDPPRHHFARPCP